MSKPPSTWKKVEATIATYLGGKRRGADFAERDGSNTGKDDVIGIPGWAIEVKHSKTASYGLACEALDQVDNVYSVVQHEAMPVAIIHRGGYKIIEESVVCFRPKVWFQVTGGQGVWYEQEIYSSYKPLWIEIVRLVVAEYVKYIPTIYALKLSKNLKTPKEFSPFVALSLPNFKEFILPLRS